MAGSILEGVRSPNAGQGFLDAMAQGNQIYGQQQNNQMRQQQIGEGDYQAALRKIQIVNKLAQKALSMPPEARGQLISQYTGVLTSVGFTPEDLAATPLDDDGLQNLVSQTDSVIRANMPQDMQQSTPASVQETEWFLRQPKNVQDAHINLKRKTDPTMAEKLDLARGQSEIKVEEVGKTEAIKQNTAAASEAADKVMTIESGLGVYDKLVDEIDNGAQTSVFTSWTPTIRDATRRFDQGARELGLGVISSTTFGALSEAELNLALETAVPKLQPEAMRKWLLDKKAAQQKLADQMYEYASFLEDGGTKVQWLKRQREMKSGRSGDGGMNKPSSDYLERRKRLLGR